MDVLVHILYNFPIILKVNDKKQKVVIAIDQRYYWKEPRIIVHQNHSFWKAGKSSLKLNGNFIENCLWTPDLKFTNVH